MPRVLTLAVAFVPLSTFAWAEVAYLKSTGSGAICSIGAPCVSLQNALNAISNFGEVVCLDRVSIEGQSVSITKSVTISCGAGLLEAPLTNGLFTITTPAGSRVLIEGLVADGAGDPFRLGDAIRFDGQGALMLRNVRVGKTFRQPLVLNSGNGLNFAPVGPASLDISDSYFHGNVDGSGVIVRPTNSGYANVHIRNTRFTHNMHGLFADGSASSIGVNVNIDLSAATNNSQNGVGAFTSVAGGAPVVVSVNNSQIAGNLVNGLGAAAVNASGAGSATIEVGNSMITGNSNGLASGGAGQIVTLGGNHLRRNSNDGSFTGTAARQ